jgi:hypothetical protein
MKNSSYVITRILLGLTLLFSFLILISCSGGNYVIIKGDIESTSHSMNGSYSKFSGYYYRQITLYKDDHVFLNYQSITHDGTIALELIDDNGNVLFKTQKLVKRNYPIHISQSGKYRIEVIGNNHKGSFKLSWHVS